MPSVAFTNSNQRSIRLFIFGGVALPLSVMALYLFASRLIDTGVSPLADWVAYGAAVASGTLCIWRQIRRLGWPLYTVLAYAVVAAGTLFWFSLGFVCGVFQDCL